jgi:oxygen-dependent protoporphyrinogen oxidase
MPQYSVGHIARVAEIDARVAAMAGLSLIGNAFHGIGIPDCVRSAQRAADRIGAA